jgi:RNA polymerase sigma-70 factor (ECF subfamily)
MDYPSLSDQQLLVSLGQRDQHALAELYQRYGTAVYSIAMRVLNNSGHAEEAAQDTFLKVWNKPDAWDAKMGAFSSWLLTVARYTAIDRLRKEVHHKPTVELDETHAALADMKEDEAGFGALMIHLPPEQALLIEMAFYQGMTHQELSDKLKLPLGTVKTRLRLGLQKLRLLWLETQQS